MSDYYRPIKREGTHLADSNDTEGAYRGNLLDDETNKPVGNSEWIKVDDSELAKVNQCSANHIKAEKKLLEEHSKELAKHLQKNEGIWLSSFWTKIMMSFFIFYTILLLIYAYIK